MCILDCLLVLAIIFYMYKAKIWMGVVTSLQRLLLDCVPNVCRGPNNYSYATEQALNAHKVFWFSVSLNLRTTYRLDHIQQSLSQQKTNHNQPSYSHSSRFSQLATAPLGSSMKLCSSSLRLQSTYLTIGTYWMFYLLTCYRLDVLSREEATRKLSFDVIPTTLARRTQQTENTCCCCWFTVFRSGLLLADHGFVSAGNVQLVYAGLKMIFHSWPWLSNLI